MKLNSSLSDGQFLARYGTHTLEVFSHEDHLRMAFLYARRGGVVAAIAGGERSARADARVVAIFLFGGAARAEVVERDRLPLP